MRNDQNLDPGQYGGGSGSSGSESSQSTPSWGHTPHTPHTPSTQFSFDFGHSNSTAKTIEELTNRFKSTLSRSSEMLPNENSEDKSTPSSSGQFLYPNPSPSPTTPSSSHCSHQPSKKLPFNRKCKNFGGSIDIHSSSVSAEEKKHNFASKSESKIAKFLRRTQSANEEHCPPPTKCGGECTHSRENHLERIDDVAEETKTRRRNKIGTDMKFRLGFLKRRHTEGTISTSVRPQPEEAAKWANSFNDLIASKYGLALFKAFLQREFSEENIEFWMAIEDYRKSRQNKLNAKAQKIFNDFIISQAPKEVNLDSLTREGVISKMSQPPTTTTFDQAQKRIQGLLESDAYLRFLKSDLYLELIHPEKYTQNTS